MSQGGYVYIMASVNKMVLYTGVTSNLPKRVWEHRNKVHVDSFTAKYNCVVLVYYQYCDDIRYAIAEEKRIKGGSRRQKESIITAFNRDWKDLSDEIGR